MRNGKQINRNETFIFTYIEFSTRKLRLYSIVMSKFVLSLCQKNYRKKLVFMSHFVEAILPWLWAHSDSTSRKCPRKTPRDQNRPMITKDRLVIMSYNLWENREIGLFFICQKSTGPTNERTPLITRHTHLTRSWTSPTLQLYRIFPINMFPSARCHYMIN